MSQGRVVERTGWEGDLRGIILLYVVVKTRLHQQFENIEFLEISRFFRISKSWNSAKLTCNLWIVWTSECLKFECIELSYYKITFCFYFTIYIILHSIKEASVMTCYLINVWSMLVVFQMNETYENVRREAGESRWIGGRRRVEWVGGRRYWKGQIKMMRTTLDGSW